MKKQKRAKKEEKKSKFLEEEVPKKKRKQKSSEETPVAEESNEESSYFRVVDKVFNYQTNIDHKVFVNVPVSQRVNILTPKGTRVLVARYPNFYKIYLYEYVAEGSKSFPYGGLKVWNSNECHMQYFYYDSVTIHPKGGIHKFKEVVEIDTELI